MSIVTITFTKNCLHTGPPIQGTDTTDKDKDKDILIPIKVSQGAKPLQSLYNSKILQ